jgi:hypothetical protein
MRNLRTTATVAFLLASTGCITRDSGASLHGVTPNSHPWFPITSGVHAIGANTADGTMACASCHQSDAPSFRQFECVKCHNHEQANTDRLHTGMKDYVYASPQCLSCHPSGSKVAFNHTGITSGCAQCHDQGKPNAALPVPGFTHPETNGLDCSSCHKTNAWKPATFDHTGITNGCAKCHDVGGTYPALPVPGFTHPPTNGLDCSSCHKTTAWKPATFDHTGITSGCAKCHDVGGTYPALPVPGFTHPPMNGADCSNCHNTTDWKTAAGAPAGKKRDPKADVMVNALIPTYAGTGISSLTPRTEQLPMSMDHGSQDVAQAALAACANCHPNSAAGNYVPGYLHAPLATLGKSDPTITQPKTCASCHSDAVPIGFVGPTASKRTPPSGPMKHDAVTWANGKPTTTALVSKECGLCHASSTGGSGENWATGKAGGTTAYHVPLTVAGQAQPSSCVDCHANSTSTGTTNSNTPTSAQTGSSTGIAAGTMAQFTHADGNVSGRDCNLCHTQNGPSTQAGVQGKEWQQAKFHGVFTSGQNPPVLDKASGRCSNCHIAEKPGAAYTAYDHGALSNTPGSDDCASCHIFPGTGTLASPNWKGAAGVPPFIVVGGFPIPQPPATAPTTQAGINNLPHPTVATGTACTACHQTAAGGKQATGYDHKSTLINTNCNSCHEAGSNLVGTKWSGATTQGTGTGDTRPFTIVGLVPSTGGNRRALSQGYNHFYPVDCAECHLVPAGNGPVTTGAAFKSAWRFDHKERRMQQSTCNMCHSSPNNLPKD